MANLDKILNVGEQVLYHEAPKSVEVMDKEYAGKNKKKNILYSLLIIVLSVAGAVMAGGIAYFAVGVSMLGYIAFAFFCPYDDANNYNKHVEYVVTDKRVIAILNEPDDSLVHNYAQSSFVTLGSAKFVTDAAGTVSMIAGELKEKKQDNLRVLGLKKINNSSESEAPAVIFYSVNDPEKLKAALAGKLAIA